MDYAQYSTRVMDACADMTGGLIAVDAVPSDAMQYHYVQGDTVTRAADTISKDMEVALVFSFDPIPAGDALCYRRFRGRK